MKEHSAKINTKKESKLIKELQEKIKQEVIGQDRAVRRLLRAVASYLGGLKDPRRPIGGFIFAGPTGVGKTWTAKVFARHLLGGKDKDRDYLTRLDGSTLSERHEVAQLKGAPPGYLGYGEASALSQENIDAYHFDVKCGADDEKLISRLKELQNFKLMADRSPLPLDRDQEIYFKSLENHYIAEKPYRSVILFDEIEKAHRNIWNVLLQIMQEGEIQLGTGKKTSFAHSGIILTTNIGQRNIQTMLKGGIGFNAAQAEDIENKDMDEKIYEMVKEQIKKKFPPELFKRFDLIVFRPLKKGDFEKILDNFLSEEQKRLNGRLKLFSRDPVNIGYTPKAKSFLLKEGIDIHYGVRTLQAVVEKYVRAPIANGLASEEIRPGDDILVEEDKEKLIFSRKPRKGGPTDRKRKSLKFIIETKSEKRGR